MTPEDREFLLSLRREQLALQQSLERLHGQLSAWENRADAAAPETLLPPEFPPLPTQLISEIVLPPIPSTLGPDLPPLPVPPAPPARPEPKPSLEFRFGKWLTRVGAVFFILFLVSADSYFHLHELLGPWGKIGLGAAVSLILVIMGQRMEQKNTNLLFFGRSLMAAGLAGLYVTLYGAHSFESLRVIRSPLLEGLLLLWWSAYVLWLAERRHSQTLAVFSITLAYFSTAINPVDAFTMAADLILAATGVLFQLRNGWAVLSYFSLVGTYLALLRRLIIDENGEFVLDTGRPIHFWPHAVYLIGAWLIFTAAVILSSAPTFRGGKRLAFLSLNNGALAGLMALTAYIAGYGYGTMGSIWLDTGFVLLITSRFVGWAQIEPEKVMAAYAAQGLALVTAGVIVVYTGLTRGVLLMMETFFLGMAAAFSADLVLTITTYVTGFFATVFIIWEIALTAHHPWLLGLGGAAVMLLNAWWARAELRHSPKARNTLVLGSSYFCVLALGLIYTSMSTELTDNILPPALALTALVLTFSIYYVSLYELPPLAQTLLLGAQALVLFPYETGEELSWQSTAGVAAVTLLLSTWWSRQRVTRTGPWTVFLIFVYALALARLAYQAVRPYVDPQEWMITSSFLSLAFLIYGAFTRVWPIAAVGQVFLIIALEHFFFTPEFGDVFLWTWWAAAVPLVVVFSTARAAHEWLRLFPEIPTEWGKPFRVLAYGYQLLALGMLVRWVCALVPLLDQVAAFLLLGTLVLAWNVYQPSTFGVRCSFVLSLTGMWFYLDHLGTNAYALATCLNGLACLGFLAQAALLRHEKSPLVTELERWALILFSVGTGWLFVSLWVLARHSAEYLTMGWALYALFLFLFGLLLGERRYRWCGLAILLTAIVRVFFSDFWGLTNGYRVLTFIVLTIVTLGLGYLILRYSDRAKPGA